jgi:hypothetical protein
LEKGQRKEEICMVKKGKGMEEQRKEESPAW